MKIIFATKNPGKMTEIRSIMGDGYEVLSMSDAGLDPVIVENGETFEENALIKVRAIGRQEDAVVLAGDSGLCIDALGGDPGVHSARWLGEDTDYIVKNRAVLDLMAAYVGEERNAHYACVIAALFPDGSEECCEARMEGRIADAPSGEGGFGFDPIIFLPEFGKTVAEISLEEKNKISHRGLALEKMKEIIEKRCRSEKNDEEEDESAHG